MMFRVVATVLSVDPDNPADTTAMIGASIALSISEIPSKVRSPAYTWDGWTEN